MPPESILPRSPLVLCLQEALQETQRDLLAATQQLRSVPWLLGALRYIADDECQYAKNQQQGTADLQLECACPVCTAKVALVRYEELQTAPSR